MIQFSHKQIALGLGLVLMVAGASWTIHQQFKANEQAELGVTQLKADIKAGRRLVESTPEKERQVIVLRELGPIFAQILPDSSEVNELIKTFYRYSGEAGVEPTSFKSKPEPNSAQGKSGFSKVAYTLSLSGDTFQFLDFLHRIETHRRFMAVPNFTLQAASRREMEELGYARHRIQMDVETYVSSPNDMVQRIKVDAYDRKRDLLTAEINRRRQALTLSTFHYRGARGRRDPWIDPRVPAEDNPSGLSVPEQNAKVEALVTLLDRADGQWEEVQDAPDVLTRMLLRRDLMASLGMVGDGLIEIDTLGLVTFIPAVKRLDLEVREPLVALHLDIDATSYVEGPTIEELEQVSASMHKHLSKGNYALAIATFAEVSEGLPLVSGDAPRELLAARLELLAEEAEVLRDFEAIDLGFGGSALIEGRPSVVILNGRSWTPGDVMPKGIEVLEIRPREGDFAFRGFVLTRHF